MASNPDRYRLSEADHQAIFEQDIKPDLFAGAKPSNQPVAVIFGGQPGAGKSAAVDSAMRELEPRGGAVQIIGDDLRGYHPHYARLMERDDKTAAFYTDRDTGQWVEKAIAEAKAQRVNIVIEGTMRDGNKVAATMESLRGAGYEIDARALAVNPRLSEQGILQRYENQKADRGTGRMTTPEAHRAAYVCLGAVIGFGVCRFFLARSALVTLFVVHFPTDPDRMRRPSFWLWAAVCAAGVVALILVTL